MIFTDEQRAAAKLTKSNKKEWAKNNLKNIYLDEAHWRSLASEIGFRLAPSSEPSTNVKYIRRLMKHLDVDNEWLERHTGCRNANEFARMEPTWTAYAIQGTLLENYFSDKEENT